MTSFEAPVVIEASHPRLKQASKDWSSYESFDSNSSDVSRLSSHFVIFSPFVANWELNSSVK